MFVQVIEKLFDEGELAIGKAHVNVDSVSTVTGPVQLPIFELS